MTTPGNLNPEALEWIVAALTAHDKALTANNNYLLARIMAIEARLNKEEPLDSRQDLEYLAGFAETQRLYGLLHTDLVELRTRLDSEAVADEQLMRDIRTMYALLQQNMHQQQQILQAMYVQRVISIIDVTAVFMLTGLVALLHLLRERANAHAKP